MSELLNILMENREEKRHFLNIAGMGFDALVVQRTNRQKEAGKNGKAIYLIKSFAQPDDL